MRVLMVHESLAGRGGAERYVQAVSAILAGEGFELAFLTAPDQRPDWTQGPVYTLQPSVGWRSGRRVKQELERLLDLVQPDLAFIHNIKEFMSPLLLNLLVERLPSVLFVHDVRLICPNQTKILRATGTPCARPVGLSCLRGGCCRSDHQRATGAWKAAAIVRWRVEVCRHVGRVIAPSRYIADELARNGIPWERILVFPYFTDRQATQPQVQCGTDLLWVGRFDVNRTKGFEMFVDALGQLRHLPWRAIVVGAGELFSDARQLVERLGLASRISFLGHLADEALDLWYARALAVVVTSRVAESFCMVGIEVMAHSRPVVAFDAGGVREWLEDGVTGFLVPYGDARALAAAIRRLLTEPQLAGPLGEAGRAMVDARFRRGEHQQGLLAALEVVRAEWSERNRTRKTHYLRRALGVIT